MAVSKLNQHIRGFMQRLFILKKKAPKANKICHIGTEERRQGGQGPAGTKWPVCCVCWTWNPGFLSFPHGSPYLLLCPELWLELTFMESFLLPGSL